MTVYVTADEARTVYPKHRREQREVLPLHAELYLLAHDDDTGELHLNPDCLAIGLAGALLLELAFTGHVVIGWAYDEFDRRWYADQGRLTVCRPGPAGSTLLDTALAAVERTIRAQPRGEHLRTWLYAFAASDLYERSRAAMVAAGLIRRTRSRRWGGLVKTETLLPVDVAYAVRARGKLRDAVAFHEGGKYLPARPDDDTVALGGLVAALELAEFLYQGQSNRELTEWLHYVVAQHNNPTITTVVQAVDAGRGDLAVKAMR
jgi:hypothetical protein